MFNKILLIITLAQAKNATKQFSIKVKASADKIIKT